MKRGKATNRLLDFYLGIPLLNFLATMTHRGVRPPEPKTIGLLFNPALGDTLLASAATQDVRSIFPEARLILFAGTSNIAAARLLPDVDDIQILPINRPIQSIRILRRNRLDLLLDFTAWQRITALYTLLSAARFTVGFERQKQYRHRGYDMTVRHRGDCHELENLRRLTRSLGAKTPSAPRLLVPPGPPDEKLLFEKNVVVFHPWASGARSWLRELPNEFWASLAERLMTPGTTFLVTGSPADEARCKAICQEIAARGVPTRALIGRNGLAEVARVLQQAAMLISVNTGVMHLGAILGTPTVSINGPTSVLRWGGVGPRVSNVCPSDGSGGFLDLGFEYHGNPTDTMNKILVEDVIHAVRLLMQPVV